jgi:linoleoyl-CoA desaturase
MPTIPSVSFPPSDSFHSELKSRVEGHFGETGRSSRGGWRMAVKTVVIVAWFAASYGLLVFGHPAGWQAALLAVSLGLAWAGIGFDVMHDANHGSYSRSRWVNRLLGFSIDLIGGSSAVWRQKHNVLHHTYTNVLGIDTDLEAGGLLRFAPDQPRHPAYRFQHLYVWALYLAFPWRWFLYDDFRDVAAGRIGRQTFARPRGRELVALVVGKAFFLGWAVVLPIALHPTGWLFPIAVLAVGTLGVVLATVFQLAHAVGEVAFVEPSAAVLPTDWARHQLATTVDFAPGNRLLSWYLGGLNFQIEHHLFPKVSHVHYRALAPIVEATCREHGVHYRAWPSFAAALGANLRWLRQMGGASPLREPGGAIWTCALRPTPIETTASRRERSFPGPGLPSAVMNK